MRDWDINDIPRILECDLEGEPTHEECLEVLKAHLESEEEYIVRTLDKGTAKDIRVLKHLIRMLSERRGERTTDE